MKYTVRDLEDIGYKRKEAENLMKRFREKGDHGEKYRRQIVEVERNGNKMQCIKHLKVYDTEASKKYYKEKIGKESHSHVQEIIKDAIKIIEVIESKLKELKK